MNRDQKKIFCVCIALVAISVFFAARHFSLHTRLEPVYQGKSLTKWLKQLDDGQAAGISSSQLPSPTSAQLEAAHAIYAMGADALPSLMEDIHARPAEDSFRINMRRWMRSHLPPVLSSPFSFPDITEEDKTRWRAAQGLAALGPLAKPALPEIKRLLYTNFWHSSIKEAAYALATIGPEGIEVLTNSIQTAPEWSGMCAIWALGQHRVMGTNVTSALIKATTSPSEGTACGAVQVLGLWHADAEHVIPALTNALAGSNVAVSLDAARALGFYGKEAASALPLLQSMTNDTNTNPKVKRNAFLALKRIQYDVGGTN